MFSQIRLIAEMTNHWDDGASGLPRSVVQFSTLHAADAEQLHIEN